MLFILGETDATKPSRDGAFVPLGYRLTTVKFLHKNVVAAVQGDEQALLLSRTLLESVGMSG